MSDVTDLNLSPTDALKMFEEQSHLDTSGANDEKEKQAAADAAAAAQAEADRKEAEAAAAAKEAEAKQKTEQEAVREDETAGVATRDGKHVIPYSVLASERAARAAAEKQLQEVQNRIAALEAKQAGQNQTANQGAAADTQAKQDEDRLALLEEDFPTVAAELKAMHALVKTLQAQVTPLEQSTKQAERERANSVAMTVQEAIDSLPKMAHIQASDPEAFALATTYDKTLRERPEWANKPMSERFQKVLELVEATNGEIKVPGQKTPSADPKALKAAAAEKLADAGKTVPTSLSQFPSGAAPAQNEHEAIDQMSTGQLAQKMARMTPAQLDSYFANL